MRATLLFVYFLGTNKKKTAKQKRERKKSKKFIIKYLLGVLLLSLCIKERKELYLFC